MKNILQSTLYVSGFVFLFSGIISCEKDFTDIGTSIIQNNVFSTNSILVDIALENKPIEGYRADNISVEPGQYLLGVYNNADYEKIEASILSQVGIPSGLKYSDTIYVGDSTFIATIDTVFLKLPYQVTLLENTSTGPSYQLDSVFGNRNQAFTLNLYQSDEYLNKLNPQDPTEGNEYRSDAVFQPIGSPLNSVVDYPFIPNENDTLISVKRRTSANNVYATDTITFSTTNSVVPVPFARIPLDEAVFKQLIFDKYESSDFSSQDAFNNYFRGLIIEASGNDGSLISFNFNNASSALNPSIEVYYTNTVLKGTQVLYGIKKNTSFSLGGAALTRRSHYKMDNRDYPANEQIKIQGTAGSEGSISLFGADSDLNGIADQLEELRLKNVFVNDALLTLYIDQSADTTLVPERLYLYKDNLDLVSGERTQSHIKDIFTENATFGGFVEKENNQKTKYSFRITAYISDLLRSETNYNPKLSLKALNPTDLNLNDTIFRPYSWNPKAVTLLNESASDGSKKAVLKISYSQKEN